MGIEAGYMLKKKKINAVQIYVIIWDQAIYLATIMGSSKLHLDQTPFRAKRPWG